MQSGANLSLKDSIVQNKSLRTILIFFKNPLLKSIVICESIVLRPGQVQGPSSGF
jgi:hypothetical protein